MLLAILAAGLAWVLAPAGRRGVALLDDGAGLARAMWRAVVLLLRRIERAVERAAPVFAAVAALVVVIVGFAEGARVAGGSDSYGYVSQAHLIAAWRVHVEPIPLAELTPAIPLKALVPLGYLLSPARDALVPTYAPGLPLVMAIGEWIAGRRAVFWVVPLLGGLAVWATYLLGRRAAGGPAGAFAAVLLASSPVLLLQLTAAPMSDLPAAAWWALALALVFREGRASALLGGLAAGLAILTRPNLVPLALVPGALLLWRALVERRGSTPPSPPLLAGAAARRGLLFVAGAIPACLAVAALHTIHYGSPLRAGYDLRGLFGLEHTWPNLVGYPALAVEMQTPLVLLALAAPLLTGGSALDARTRGRAVTLVAAAFVLAVLACYLFYPAFDARSTLRFLLPAIPPLLVLVSVSIAAFARRLPAGARFLLLAAVSTVAAVHGVADARERGAFHTEVERKYALIGEHIARRLPASAVLLAMQHSGSARYYSGRPTVRYDLLPERRLDRVVGVLQREGYRPYILLEPWEVERFRERFQDRSPLGLLDWPPLVELEREGVRIYDPADREPVRGGEGRVTEILPWPPGGV